MATIKNKVVINDVEKAPKFAHWKTISDLTATNTQLILTTDSSSELLPWSGIYESKFAKDKFYTYLSYRTQEILEQVEYQLEKQLAAQEQNSWTYGYTLKSTSSEKLTPKINGQMEIYEKCVNGMLERRGENFNLLSLHNGAERRLKAFGVLHVNGIYFNQSEMTCHLTFVLKVLVYEWLKVEEDGFGQYLAGFTIRQPNTPEPTKQDCNDPITEAAKIAGICSQMSDTDIEKQLTKTRTLNGVRKKARRLRKDYPDKTEMITKLEEKVERGLFAKLSTAVGMPQQQHVVVKKKKVDIDDDDLFLSDDDETLSNIQE